MKIIYFIFFILLLTTTSIAQDWQELKGTHFLVYFTKDKAFANKVLRRAEKNYERIAGDLGYARYSDFWTWANRVKIYIHPNHSSYVQVCSQPEWSHGMADYPNKSIHSYAGSKNFLVSIVPHEIAHLIFRDFIGFESNIPLWLDEGVAIWEEETDKSRIKGEIREFLRKRAILSITDMMELDIRYVTDSNQVHLYTNKIEDKPGFLILDANSLVNLFYTQAASLVGFLIEQYGANTFTEFCREIRDGKNLQEALRRAYAPHLRTIEEFENKWIEYLKEE